MYCNKCFFYSSFRDMSATIHYCTFEKERNLSVDTLRCDVANKMNNCSQYLDKDFVKDFVRHHFFQ